jgi:hypothetical protein
MNLFSQDFKVEKLKLLTKEKYKVTRILVITDSTKEYDINEFIDEFIQKLTLNCSERNIELRFIKRGTNDVLTADSLIKSYNPNGVVKFKPTQFYNQYRGLITKTGLYFNFGLSFRQENISDFVPLFSTRIGVITDSFETAGILAANDIFDKLLNSGFVLLDKPTNSKKDYFD